MHFHYIVINQKNMSISIVTKILIHGPDHFGKGGEKSTTIVEKWTSKHTPRIKFSKKIIYLFTYRQEIEFVTPSIQFSEKLYTFMNIPSGDCIPTICIINSISMIIPSNQPPNYFVCSHWISFISCQLQIIFKNRTRHPPGAPKLFTGMWIKT